MVAGAPFPDIYDWTWGEVVEYIACREEARKEDARMDASLLFRHASLVSQMFSGKSNNKFSVMDTFSFLWSKKEIQEAKAEQRHAGFFKKRSVIPTSLDEQDRMLSALKKKMLAERNK